MSQHVAVEQFDDKRSHWRVLSLAGVNFQWDTEVINDIPGELLAWCSLEGADLDHAGSVHFENADGGTKAVIMEYRPPAGRLGAEIAALFGENPGQVIERDLHRLKEPMENRPSD